MTNPKQKEINITLDKGRELANLFSERIGEDLENCEKSIEYFSPDNKYLQGIKRSVGRIKKLLKDLKNAKEIKVITNEQEDTAYSLLVVTNNKKANNSKININENQLRLFKSAVRHDLRNPLASALGYLDLINLKVKTKSEKQYAENISNSLKNILEKINETG